MQVWKYVLDGLYILFAAVTIFVFTKRGFIDSVFRFGRTLFAGAICYFVGPYVSDAIYEKWMHQSVVSWVSSRIEQFLVAAADSFDLASIIEELPFFVKQLVDSEALIEKYGATVSNFDTVAHDFAMSVSQPLATLLSNLIAYLAVFFAAMLLLFVLFKVLDGIFKLPILNAINKTLGFLLGIAGACLMLGALTFGIGFFAGTLGSTEMIAQLEELSVFYRFFHGIEIFELF